MARATGEELERPEGSREVPEGQRQVDKSARVFVPLKEAIWRDKVAYSYDDKTAFGTFHEANNFEVFAPERGNIFPRPDGGLVILVPAGPGEELDRQWLIGPVKFSQNFRNGDVIEAGQLLGTVNDDNLRVAFFAAPKGGVNFVPVDPVDVLQRSGAAFPDDKTDKAPNPRKFEERGPAKDPEDFRDKKFNISDLLITGGLAAFGGMALGFGFKK